jgi:Sulfotransferase family
MTKPSSIRITDLAAPEYSDFAREILGAIGDTETEISVEAVYTEAAAQLGDIATYRDDGVIERLGVICGAMNDDHNLSPLGRMTNRDILVRYLVQRSRLEELYRRHPEIDEVEIVRPIIIAGLPRSGTTHLLNLISQDDRLRSLRYWESLEPIPCRDDENIAEGEEDPRIQRCRDSLAMQDQIMPLFKNMHEMSPEHIHEEIELMGMDYSMMLFENYAVLPKWRDYYLDHDQTPHYQFLKRALKALQWLRGPQRWILKSPQHMEQLIPLKTVFPDATFVLPHRDPVSVITSMVTMQSYVSRMSRDPVVPAEIGEHWADRIVRMLRQCARDRDQLPESQAIDIMFEEIIGDDVAAVERIYNLADHPMTDTVRNKMKRYVEEHPRGKHGQILYDLEQDFGIERAALRRQLGFYYDKFPVKSEG